MTYPKVEETKRPYRLWHEQEKQQVRYRYYSDPKRAHIGALIECKFVLKPNETITVWNCLTGRMLSSYTLRFKEGKGYIYFTKG